MKGSADREKNNHQQLRNQMYIDAHDLQVKVTEITKEFGFMLQVHRG